MSLISLLIALAAERYLSSPVWQFNQYYQQYLQLFDKFQVFGKAGSSVITNAIFIAIPVIITSLVLELLDDGLLYLVASTLILIVCFGCAHTRDYYKQFLLAAFRGEQTTCEMHHQQLLQDKNLPHMGFGQALVWLNYRYFIAIMIFFVIFGAPGALAYRLLTKVTESKSSADESDEQASQEDNYTEQQADHTTVQVLFWLDWLPVRIVAFGYMLVGHFSKAMPAWLENLFDAEKQPHHLLIEVAQKSEDFMVDADDCTAEPCLLVRLAKRTLLLCLAINAILILTGVLS